MVSSLSTRVSSKAEAALTKLLVLFLLAKDLFTEEYLGSSSARLRKGVEVESSMAGDEDMYQVWHHQCYYSDTARVTSNLERTANS